MTHTCGAPGWDADRAQMVTCPLGFDHAGPHTWQRPTPPPAMADERTAEATLRLLLSDAYADARLAGEGRYGAATRQLEAVCRYVDKLHALVRWFDLAYGPNEPTWLTENMYGQPLPANVELTETYRGVIGDKAAPSPI